MKPPPFQYHCPRELKDAIALLSSLENAKLLAGGQSLMPMLNMRFVLPDHVIDLNRVEGLAHISETGDAVVIGSMTRQRDIERSPVVGKRLPVLVEALRNVGHVQTRNRGTIGGSLCHLDPSAELAAMAMAYDAEIQVEGPRGRRSMPMAAFPAAYMTPQIEADEIVTAIRFPLWPDGHFGAFEEFARRHGDFAVVSAAAILLAGRDGRIQRASVTISGIGAAPLRITAAEQALTGQMPTDAAIRSAAARCGEIDAMQDAYASSAYRQHLATVLAERALRRALARTNAPVD